MTIVAEMGGWHIEFHMGIAVAIGTQAVVLQTITLDRPGRFMWATVYIADAIDTFLLTSSFDHLNGFPVVFGDIVNNGPAASESIRFAMGNANTTVPETGARGGLVIAIRD